MARLSGRIIRIALFTIFIIGLVSFLSSSGTNYVPVANTDSKTTGSSNAKLTAEQSEKLNEIQQAAVNDDSKSSVSSFASSALAAFGAASGSSSAADPQTYVRENATFISLARDEDLWSLADAIRSVEDRFNNKYKYDWVFLNDGEFSDEFKTVMTRLVSGEAKFGIIPKEHWSYPEWIDQDKAAETREKMKNIIYGSSVSYRHMCRFESGFFYRHPLMLNYQYYWRVEPSTKLHCDVDYDVFKFMREQKKDYGFTISIHEFRSTIETLWDSTKEFINTYPQYVAQDNLMGFISDDNGATYNLCHFWTNFEVGNMDLWRSEAYTKYFEYLDKKGGFFYERWGDAPIHSIAAALFVPKDRVHYFEEIGYFHGPYHNCPINDAVRVKNNCVCNPKDDFTWKDYSCTRRYYDIRGFEKPTGWDKHTG